MYYVIKDVLEYYRMCPDAMSVLNSRSIALNIDNNLIELTHSYPHYNKGLRGVEISSNNIILYIDLSFLNYFDISLKDTLYTLVVISNEKNLRLEHLNSNGDMYDIYFNIDMSNSSLRLSTYSFNKYELINWINSGLNLIIDGYDLYYNYIIRSDEDALKLAEEFNLNILDNLDSSNCRLSRNISANVNLEYYLTFNDEKFLLLYLSTLSSLLKNSYSVPFKYIQLSFVFILDCHAYSFYFDFLNNDVKPLFDNFEIKLDYHVY